MPPRLRRLLAPPLVVLAFALSLTVSLRVRPATYRIEPTTAGIAVYLLLAAASAAVPAVTYALVTGAFRRRPAAWDSNPAGHRFSAPPSPRQAAAMITSAGLVAQVVPVERVPNQDQVRIAQLGAFTMIMIVVVAVYLITIVVLSMTNSPSIVLSPKGLTLRRPLRRDEIRWDKLLPGGPPRPAKRNPGTIDVLRSAATPGRPAERLSLPSDGLHIDAAFLAYAIRWYVEHPDRRAQIGNALELAELLRGFASENATPP
ncbi:hypothetical protein [Paractinoplanes toevensis]|uniref:PH domain-containing protein n=1 Tax=Paractinoplanes toevensis TaxID=571911 RepID=A0A920BR84_9ACTN|nr:hypothetical protein [Actinoplanes toevensis]GIM97800.1 hypothetical protein Ato02nite_095930 [Actinoplanes toevensis]